MRGPSCQLSLNITNLNFEDVHHSSCSDIIPYSGKRSREKTFCELVKNTIFVEKTFADCLVLQHQRCHAPKFHGELS